VIEREAPTATVACRNAARELVDQRRHGLDVVPTAVRSEQPDAAVDVEPNTTRRDDSVGRQGRRYPAHWKAVALVHVRHADGEAHDAWQRAHVRELLEASVTTNLLQQHLIGDDASGNAHVVARAGRRLIEHVSDALEFQRNHVWNASSAR